ncbi:MAG TPA: Ig-like domain-containing protein [Polyangiaceae bacterium]|nr:Ig-like domain-containing protein [Polyangiaceae bacterium]
MAGVGCSSTPTDPPGNSSGAAGTPAATAGGNNPSGAAGSTQGGTGAATGGSGNATAGTGANIGGSAAAGAANAGGTSASGGTGNVAGSTSGANSGGSSMGGAAGAPPVVGFGSPVGKIANNPQPASIVGLPKDRWKEGIISPSLLKGKHLNQPVVANGYMVMAGNEEFWTYDMSNPASPKQLAAFKTPGGKNAEAESHTISFARYGDKFYMVTLSGFGIDTWDVTNASAPMHVAQLKVPGTSYGDYTEAIWGVTWQGQYIFVGATNNGIKVVDAANPAALKIVGEVSTSQYGGVSAGPLEAIGNILVVMTPKESGGIATLDISDPLKPTRLASVSANSSYIGMFHRHYAFLISPLRVWDVLTNPKSLGTSPLGTLNHEGAEYISFSDDYLFLGHVRTEISGNPGASKISVADPAKMKVVERIWGRLDLGGKNDDQFTIPLGNLLVIADDQAPGAGWFVAAHQAAPDTAAPIIDTVIPKDKTTAVSVKTRIGVTFSDNIEIATVNAASFIVRPVGGQPLPGKFGLRMSVINFDPDGELQPATTYEVVLPKGGVADLVGNRLATDWKTTFTTN